MKYLEDPEVKEMVIAVLITWLMVQIILHYIH